MTQEEDRCKQRMLALASANLIRTRRAEIKRSIKRQDTDPRAVLADLPLSCEGVGLVDFLKLVPGIGPVKARAMAKQITKSPTTPNILLGRMSDRGRDAAIEALACHFSRRRTPDPHRAMLAA